MLPSLLFPVLRPVAGIHSNGFLTKPLRPEGWVHPVSSIINRPGEEEKDPFFFGGAPKGSALGTLYKSVIWEVLLLKEMEISNECGQSLSPLFLVRGSIWKESLAPLGLALELFWQVLLSAFVESLFLPSVFFFFFHRWGLMFPHAARKTNLQREWPMNHIDPKSSASVNHLTNNLNASYN